MQRVIKRTGTKPRTVTADRSYGEKAIEDDLHGLGVRHVVIPRKGKPGQARQAAERRPAFRRAVKWRTGSEGRISTLKRQYGWDRARHGDLDQAVHHGLTAFSYDRKTEASLLSHAVDLDHLLSDRYPDERMAEEFHQRYREARAALRHKANSDS